jgi:hypothetical protein
MTQRRVFMTHALLVLALAAGLVDCGKYGRPSRVLPGSAAATPAAPSDEACEDETKTETPPSPEPSPQEPTP